MRNRRSVAIIASAASVMLFAGVAFAQVGSLSPRAPELGSRTFGEIESGALVSAVTADAETRPTPGAAQVAGAGTRALVVEYPAAGERFDGEALTIRGSAPPGWTVQLAQLTTVADRDGTWELTVILAPGDNRIAMTATSPDGGDALGTEVTVHYDVAGSHALAADEPDGSADPDGPEGDNPISDPSFDAAQKYAQSPRPREVFWGSGSPGDIITAMSLYGDATTLVDKQGRWDLHLAFHEAPIDTAFDVVIESASGGSAAFTFTYLGPDTDATRRSWAMNNGRRPSDRFFPRIDGDSALDEPVSHQADPDAWGQEPSAGHPRRDDTNRWPPNPNTQPGLVPGEQPFPGPPGQPGRDGSSTGPSNGHSAGHSNGNRNGSGDATSPRNGNGYGNGPGASGSAPRH